MPKDKVVDFVAVDEIQMCGDPKEDIYLQISLAKF